MLISKKKWMKVGVLLIFATPLLASSETGGHGPNVVELLARTLNVAVFAWILYYFLKNPIADFFAARVAKIKENLELAKSSREEAEKCLAEIEEKMAGLTKHLEEIAVKAREDAEQETIRLKKKAEEETEKVRLQAAREIENAKVEAISQIKRHVVDLAMDRVESVITERMSPTDQERLIKEFSEKVGA